MPQQLVISFELRESIISYSVSPRESAYEQTDFRTWLGFLSIL